MFEIHKTTLQLLKRKDNYDKLKGVINRSLIDSDINRALTVLDAYWKNYPEHNNVKPDLFLTELAVKYPDLDPASLAMYKGMSDIMQQEPDDASAKGLLRSLRTLDFASKLETAHEIYQTGGDIDLHVTVQELLEAFELDISRDKPLDFCRDDIHTIMTDAESGHRLPWFLSCLNGSMPDVKTGMQIIVAARPGKGKTSFCARQAVSLAKKTPDNRPIMWLNNEGKGSRIKGTLYRAALKSSFHDMKKIGAPRVAELYNTECGDKDRIRVFDIHARSYHFIEQLFKRHKPAVVFFDMLDNVQGFATAARQDLRLEMLYQWAREQAVIHDFLSIPTSQISVEGEGLAWCAQSMLKDSKTAKQGACDAIITMGATANRNQEWSRFMYIPKAHKGDPLKGHRADCATEVIFTGATCQFKEPDPGEPTC